jgi:hypothetical protein
MTDRPRPPSLFFMESASVAPVNRPRARHLLHGAALLIGAVVLVFLIDNLGRDGFESAILGTGRWFLVLAAIDLAAVMCDAAGVYCFVRPHAEVSYLRVFFAQASGLAINRLTPGNSLGEPIKVTMLMRHVPEAPAVSSIVKFNITTYVVAMTTIAIGVPLTLLSMDLPATAQLLIIAIVSLLVAAVLGLVILAKRGALTVLVRAGRRMRLLSAARAERWTNRLAEIDAHIRELGDRATKRALPFVFMSRALTMFGGIVILIATDTELTPALVFAQLSIAIIITWASNVVPLGLGLADGGNYALYGAIGASPAAGLEFAMINRVRTVVLASMGLAVMTTANLFDRATREAR